MFRLVHRLAMGVRTPSFQQGFMDVEQIHSGAVFFTAKKSRLIHPVIGARLVCTTLNLKENSGT